MTKCSTSSKKWFSLILDLSELNNIKVLTPEHKSVQNFISLTKSTSQITVSFNNNNKEAEITVTSKVLEPNLQTAFKSFGIIDGDASLQYTGRAVTVLCTPICESQNQITFLGLPSNWLSI